MDVAFPRGGVDKNSLEYQFPEDALLPSIAYGSLVKHLLNAVGNYFSTENAGCVKKVLSACVIEVVATLSIPLLVVEASGKLVLSVITLGFGLLFGFMDWVNNDPDRVPPRALFQFAGKAFQRTFEQLPRAFSLMAHCALPKEAFQLGGPQADDLAADDLASESQRDCPPPWIYGFDVPYTLTGSTLMENNPHRNFQSFDNQYDLLNEKQTDEYPLRGLAFYPAGRQNRDPKPNFERGDAQNFFQMDDAPCEVAKFLMSEEAAKRFPSSLSNLEHVLERLNTLKSCIERRINYLTDRETHQLGENIDERKRVLAKIEADRDRLDKVNRKIEEITLENSQLERMTGSERLVQSAKVLDLTQVEPVLWEDVNRAESNLRQEFVVKELGLLKAAIERSVGNFDWKKPDLEETKTYFYANVNKVTRKIVENSFLGIADASASEDRNVNKEKEILIRYLRKLNLNLDPLFGVIIAALTKIKENSEESKKDGFSVIKGVLIEQFETDLGRQEVELTEREDLYNQVIRKIEEISSFQGISIADGVEVLVQFINFLKQHEQTFFPMGPYRKADLIEKCSNALKFNFRDTGLSTAVMDISDCAGNNRDLDEVFFFKLAMALAELEEDPDRRKKGAFFVIKETFDSLHGKHARFENYYGKQEALKSLLDFYKAHEDLILDYLESFNNLWVRHFNLICSEHNWDLAFELIEKLPEKAEKLKMEAFCRLVRVEKNGIKGPQGRNALRFQALYEANRNALQSLLGRSDHNPGVKIHYLEKFECLERFYLESLLSSGKFEKAIGLLEAYSKKGKVFAFNQITTYLLLEKNAPIFNEVFSLLLDYLPQIPQVFFPIKGEHISSLPTDVLFIVRVLKRLISTGRLEKAKELYQERFQEMLIDRLNEEKSILNRSEELTEQIAEDLHKLSLLYKEYYRVDERWGYNLPSRSEAKKPVSQSELKRIERSVEEKNEEFKRLWGVLESFDYREFLFERTFKVLFQDLEGVIKKEKESTLSSLSSFRNTGSLFGWENSSNQSTIRRLRENLRTQEDPWHQGDRFIKLLNERDEAIEKYIDRLKQRASECRSNVKSLERQVAFAENWIEDPSAFHETARLKKLRNPPPSQRVAAAPYISAEEQDDKKAYKRLKEEMREGRPLSAYNRIEEIQGRELRASAFCHLALYLIETIPEAIKEPNLEVVSEDSALEKEDSSSPAAGLSSAPDNTQTLSLDRVIRRSQLLLRQMASEELEVEVTSDEGPRAPEEFCERALLCIDQGLYAEARALLEQVKIQMSSAATSA